MYAVIEGLRITEGPRGTSICYLESNSDGIEIDSFQSTVLKTILGLRYANDQSLLESLLCTRNELVSSIEVLLELGLIQVLPQDFSIHEHSHRDTGNSRWSLTEVEPYRYYIADLAPFLSKYGILCTPNWLKLGKKLFPILVLSVIIVCIQFYFSWTRGLGNSIKSEIFYSPSIYEAFIVFDLTSFLTIIYKILVGISAKMASGKIYLKLLAGFHPTFDTEKDEYHTSFRHSRRPDYIYYIASPAIARLYLLLICSLLVIFMYPFLGTYSHSVLSILMTTINVSWFALLWQVIPSPGTLSLKLLEVNGVIPERFLGISVREVMKSLVTKDQNRYISKWHILYILTTLILVCCKLVFLFFWVLPEITGGLPSVLGEWTGQIVFIFLVLATVKYIYFAYFPENARRRLLAALGGNHRQTNDMQSHQSKLTNSVDAKKVSINKYTFNWKSVLFIFLLIFLFPFAGSVSGYAVVEQNNALDIKVKEALPAYVWKVYRQGPSSTEIRKGEKILALKSDALALSISEKMSEIKSLEASVNILKTKIASNKSGGSSFVSSLNKSDDLAKTVSDLKASEKIFISYGIQYRIALSQADRYKKLLKDGAVSELQYEDKLLSAQAILAQKDDAERDILTYRSELAKAKRNEIVEQRLKIGENLQSLSEEQKQATTDLIQAKLDLTDLERREKDLIITAPFNCVIETDTSLLAGKEVSTGDSIVTVRAYPTERVVVQIPEYSRSLVNIGDKTIIRLYNRVLDPKGHLEGKVVELSPVSDSENDQEKVDLLVKTKSPVTGSMIGSTGTAKVYSGYTCLLLNLLKPLVRFVEVDLWQYTP